MRLVLLAPAFLLAGCAAAEDPASACVDESGIEEACYFRNVPAAPAVADCVARTELDLPVSLDVALFRATSGLELLPVTRALARYYGDYGVSFHASSPPTELGQRYLITGSEQELNRALDEAGIARRGELSPEEQATAERIVAEVLFRPLTEFLLAHAVPEAPLLNFAVFERVVDPRFAAELGISGEITGLGFSPTLFRHLREQGRDDGLFDLLGIPENFTPSAFLARDSLKSLVYPDNAVAHEVGHALGLPHVEDRTNLMHPSVGEGCRAVLTAEQAEAIVAPNDAWNHAEAPDDASGFDQPNALLSLHRAAADRVLRSRVANPLESR